MRFLSYGIALAIIVVIAVYMASGVLVRGGQGPGNGETPIVSVVTGQEAGSHEVGEGQADPHKTIAERNADTTAENGAARSVRIETFTVQPMPLEVTLRGRTEAKAKVGVAAETSGIVKEVLVSKGDRVEAGDLLCMLDRGTREASVAQAEAALAQAQLNFETNEQLREKGVAASNSRSAVEVALKSAQAQLDQAKAELERTEIRTEISGIVEDPVANVGTMLNPGSVCATVVKLDPMIFVGSIPEVRVGLARTGLPVEIETVSGQTASGKVTFVSSTADSSTRTFGVEAEISNPSGNIRDGLTATAMVDMGTMPAHLLPQSALTLDSEGVLGIRAVEGDVVVFHPITIVRDTREGVWVTGLPAQVDVITLGQEYVAAGQVVDAKKADEGSV